MAGDFADDALFDQHDEGGVGGGGGETEFGHEARDGDHGLFLEDVVELDRGGPFAAEGVEAGAVLLKNLEQSAGGVGGLVGGFFDALQEEIEPLFPGAVGADALEEFVVGAAVFFEKKAEIEERLGQDAVVAEQHRDEEAAGAAVAVEERVDGLELRVGEAGADEGGHVVVVKEEFERAHAREDLVGRGRDEEGVAGARAGDPVLRGAEFAGLLFAAATFCEEHAMDFFDEAEGKRKTFGEALHAVLHRGDVVGHLGDVVQRGAAGGVVFEEQEFGEGGLRAFDLGREDGFLAHVGVEEELGVGEQSGDAGEPAEGDAGALGHALEGAIPLERRRRRQRLGHKGETGFADKGNGGFGAVGTSFHN